MNRKPFWPAKAACSNRGSKFCTGADPATGGETTFQIQNKFKTRKNESMKTKTKFILKSLAELPANALALVGSVPGRAREMTQRVLVPPLQGTRRQIRAAHRRSAEFIKDLSTRASTPFNFTLPAGSGQQLFARASAPAEHRNSWLHGGLNE
jgi:hypothetical protein